MGSHILDRLRQDGREVRLLLRETSDTGFILPHLDDVDVCYGSLSDRDSLAETLEDVTSVIHCAGKTKAVHPQDYYTVNRDGTANLVEAANRRSNRLRHFVQISSRAVSPPATGQAPASEDTPPEPVSEYGRSKLQAENVVRETCNIPWTILRPSAVYGPRDTDFFGLFRAARWHIRPLFDGGTQELSLVYAPDLSRAAVRVLEETNAYGRTYNVAETEIRTTSDLTDHIARAMDTWTIPLYLPGIALYPLCLAQQWISRLSGKASILNLQKYAELRAPGWACSVDRIREDLGFECPTDLSSGVRRTLDWYRTHEWL